MTDLPPLDPRVLTASGKINARLERWWYGAEVSTSHRDTQVYKPRMILFMVEALGMTMTHFREEGVLWKGIDVGNDQFMTGWLAPRGCGKSQTGTVGEITWYLCFYPDDRNIIIGETRDLAKLMLREIKAHVVSPMLCHYFGELRGDNWSAYYIDRRGKKPAKEYSVECLGIGGNVIGRHVDRIYPDDIISKENTRTQKMRDDVRGWFDMALMPLLEPGAHLRIRGTRYHNDDLYATLEKRYPGMFVTHQAILKDENNQERSFYEKRFPLEWLREKRRVAPVAFSYQYQNDTRSVASTLITPGVCRCWLPQETPVVKPEQYDCWRFYGGIDLAGTEKTAGDRTAMTIGLFHKPTQVTYVMEVFVDRIAAFDKQMRAVYNRYARFRSKGRFQRIGVENNGYQTIFSSTLLQDPRYSDMPLEAFNQQKDKVTHMQLHTPYINAGKILFAPGLEWFIERLEAFPDQTEGDDDTDSFAIMLSQIDDIVSYREDAFFFDVSPMELPSGKDKGKAVTTTLAIENQQKRGLFLPDIRGEVHDRLF